jgi:uncharacterized HhH-GPD family protein
VASSQPGIHIAGADADALINTNPFALMVGMLLDQQISIELAFLGPKRLADRIDNPFSAATVAAMDVDEFVTLCCQRPAVHRFPAAMGRRIHALALALVASYGGDAAQVWTDVRTGTELHDRLRQLPGFGPEKTEIFIAVLAKRFGLQPRGWKTSAGVFSDATPRSIADVFDPASLAAVRAFKTSMRAVKRDKQGRAVSAD